MAGFTLPSGPGDYLSPRVFNPQVLLSISAPLLRINIRNFNLMRANCIPCIEGKYFKCIIM